MLVTPPPSGWQPCGRANDMGTAVFTSRGHHPSPRVSEAGLTWASIFSTACLPGKGGQTAQELLGGPEP